MFTSFKACLTGKKEMKKDNKTKRQKVKKIKRERQKDFVYQIDLEYFRMNGSGPESRNEFGNRNFRRVPHVGLGNVEVKVDLG